MTIKVEDFGSVENQKVELFTLANKNQIQIKISNYGGIVTSIETPDKNGDVKNVVLGFESLEEYLSEQYLSSYPYFGSIIGRVGNRISKGAFELDGVHYQVSKNRENFHLHGGYKGFDKVVWNATLIKSDKEIGVRLNYLSPDGEEGYPGNLNVVVEYTLNKENEFSIAYFAETDKATPVNLTQHTYFNLGSKRTIENHYLQLNSSEIMEADQNIIPTGKMLNVKSTPFDFRELKRIGQDIDELENGYDHTYSLHNEKGDLIMVGELQEPQLGRKIEFYTTEVSMQLYTGFWNPELTVQGAPKFGKFSGVAIETQHFPDSVNRNEFPSTILRPGEKYNEKTIFKFSVTE